MSVRKAKSSGESGFRGEKIARARLFGDIGHRLLLWFTLVSILPLLLLGVRGYQLARDAVVREVFLHMEAVAANKQAQVEHWLRQSFLHLDLLAAHPRIYRDLTSPRGPQDAAGRSALLESWLENDPSFIGIGICTADGRLVDYRSLRAIRGHPAPACEDSGRWLTARTAEHSSEQRFYFTPVRYQPETGTWFSVKRRLSDERGNTVGWLIGSIAVSRSLDSLLTDSTGLGRTGHTYLVDQERWMLTRSRHMDHPAPGTHKMSSAAIDSALIGGSGVGIYRGWDGETALGAWRSIAPTGWALIGEMSAREALAEVWRFRRNWLLGLSLTLVVILMVVAWISKSISQPILRLSAAAKRISAGDLTARTDLRRNDEIGRLGEAFDQMSAALTESRKSLEKSYDELLTAERRLVQAEKLAAIGEWVAGVVHELRNPLSAIKMNLKILGKKKFADTTAAEHLQIAQDQTQKLERMLSDLLEFSKPVKGKSERLEIGGIIREAAAYLQEFALVRGIKLELQIAPEYPAVQGDKDLLVQALTNILRNAVEAYGDSMLGTVTVTARETHAESGGVLIEIEDRGKGLTKTQSDRIFEPFFTTKPHGTGLGLLNARKAVELHRGRLEIESQENVGTRVRIYLPGATHDAGNSDR
jgi:signal transduction histidine kinase